jgi:hypothetical protein
MDYLPSYESLIRRPPSREEVTMATRKSPTQPATNGQAYDDAFVKKVIALRKAGKGWAEISEGLNGGESIKQLTIRPLMKKLDPSSVRPSYDREDARKKREAAAKPKRSRAKATA